MRMFYAITFLILLALYVFSYFVMLSPILESIREYAERTVLYFYLLSLALLALSQIGSAIFSSKKKTTSEMISENFKAHVYTTRAINFLVMVGFPLFVYFNLTRNWNLSDAVIVAIPATLLALVIAEQNIYTYATSRLERIGIEHARVAAVFQIVESILKGPRRDGAPDDYELNELEERLLLWEERTAESNFAKFAAQARSTLRAIRRNNAKEIWNPYLERLHSDLREYVDTYS